VRLEVPSLLLVKLLVFYVILVPMPLLLVYPAVCWLNQVTMLMVLSLVVEAPPRKWYVPLVIIRPFRVSRHAPNVALGVHNLQQVNSHAPCVLSVVSKMGMLNLRVMNAILGGILTTWGRRNVMPVLLVIMPLMLELVCVLHVALAIILVILEVQSVLGVPLGEPLAWKVKQPVWIVN
jgi:hypothetical protein